MGIGCLTINIHNDTEYTVEEYIEKLRKDPILFGKELKCIASLPADVKKFLKKITNVGCYISGLKKKTGKLGYNK